jgi:hypothetical protein
MGSAVVQWLRCCATNRKVAGSIKLKPLGVESASNRNEYQEHFLGGKGGRCVRLTTLPPSCAAVTKSGNHNFLEPSGPLQVCNGTALPLSILNIISNVNLCGDKLMMTLEDNLLLHYLMVFFSNATLCSDIFMIWYYDLDVTLFNDNFRSYLI